jgi:hypothetical protein
MKRKGNKATGLLAVFWFTAERTQQHEDKRKISGPYEPLSPQ